MHFTIIESVAEKAHRFVMGTAYKSVAVEIATKGIWGFIYEVYGHLSDMQSVDATYDQRKRLQGLMIALKAAANGKPISSLPGVDVKNGILTFKSLL